jgi:hypothetical protein
MWLYIYDEKEEVLRYILLNGVSTCLILIVNAWFGIVAIFWKLK